VKVDFALTPENLISNSPDRPLDGVQDIYGDDEEVPKLVYHTVEEEIAMAPACWLWDYLRYIEPFSSIPFFLSDFCLRLATLLSFLVSISFSSFHPIKLSFCYVSGGLAKADSSCR